MKKLQPRERHFVKSIRTLGLPNTIKAARLLIDEMNAENGFSRHDGSDYFVHPIAIAQTAIDNQAVNNYIQRGEIQKADYLLAACLLHDVLEDVEKINPIIMSSQFDPEITKIVENVTKREGEPFLEYKKRFMSHEISCMVKCLDRQNNVATLSKSSHEHRVRQFNETTDYYLDIFEEARNQYWEFGHIYHQIKTTVESILAEVEVGINLQNQLDEIKSTLDDEILEELSIKYES